MSACPSLEIAGGQTVEHKTAVATPQLKPGGLSLDQLRVPPAQSKATDFLELLEFELQEELSRDGISRLLKIRQPTSGFEGIAKVPCTDSDLRDAALLLESEAQRINLLAQSHSPHLLPFAMKIPGGNPGYITTFIPHALDQAISSGLSFSDVVRYFRHAIEAVSTVHARLGCHGDIRPSNFRLTSPDDGDYLVLVDYRSVQEKHRLILDAASKSKPEDALDADTASIVSLSHIAPEQRRGQSADVVTDVFQLTQLLYEMAHGGMPDCAGIKPLSGEFAVLNTVIERGMAERPERFQSVAELSEAFEEAINHAAAESEPAPNDAEQELMRLSPDLIRAALVEFGPDSDHSNRKQFLDESRKLGAAKAQLRTLQARIERGDYEEAKRKPLAIFFNPDGRGENLLVRQQAEWSQYISGLESSASKNIIQLRAELNRFLERKDPWVSILTGLCQRCSQMSDSLNTLWANACAYASNPKDKYRRPPLFQSLQEYEQSVTNYNQILQSLPELLRKDFELPALAKFSLSCGDIPTAAILVARMPKIYGSNLLEEPAEANAVLHATIGPLLQRLAAELKRLPIAQTEAKLRRIIQSRTAALEKLIIDPLERSGKDLLRPPGNLSF